MPWSCPSPMDQKIRFIVDYQRHFFSLAELCTVRRPTRSPTAPELAAANRA
jgi:hypothetical protein